MKINLTTKKDWSYTTKTQINKIAREQLNVLHWNTITWHISFPLNLHYKGKKTKIGNTYLLSEYRKNLYKVMPNEY